MSELRIKLFSNLKIKYLLVFIWMLGGLAVHAKEPTMVFPADALLLASPDIRMSPAGALKERMTLPVTEQTNVIFQNMIVSTELTFYRVSLQGQDWWVAPNWQVRNGKGQFVDSEASIHRVAAGSLLLLGILLALCGLKRDDNKKTLKIPRAVLLVMALILFHYAWLKYFNSIYPGAFQSPTDENEYFRITDSLINWDFHKPFAYTLGYPLFCLPFVASFGMSNTLVLSQVIAAFSSMVMMPVNIVLAFFLLRNVCSSEWKAFGAIALWQLLPKIFIMVELPYQGAILSPLGLYHSDYIFQAYQFCLNGMNSLSEWVSSGLLLTTGLIAINRSGAGWRYSLAGGVLGLACLVRLNNIFWLPLIVYLFWCTDQARLIQWRYLVKATVLAGVMFGLVFIWQLIVNRLQFCHFLTFPYILHSEKIHAGFQFENLMGVSKYHFSILAVPLCWTLAALAVMREARMRNLLILWIFPMLLFFCGFVVTGQHYRFFMPLFYGMTGAVVAVEFWPQINWRQRILLVLLLLVMVMPKLPWEWNWDTGANSKLYLYTTLHKIRLVAWLPLLFCCLWSFRRNRQVLGFILIFTVLAIVSQPMVYLAATLGLLGYASVSMIKEVITVYRQQKRVEQANE